MGDYDKTVLGRIEGGVRKGFGRTTKFLNESQNRVYDLSGLRLIWFKIRPPVGEFKRRPSSIFVWLIGLYVAYYGLASQRYMDQLAQVEYEFNLSVAQLSTKSRKAALTRLAQIQRKKIPIEPKFGDSIRAFFWLLETETPQKFLSETAAIIVSAKDDLRGVDLGAVGLRDAYLSDANMVMVQMRGANLMGANLHIAGLIGANLMGANLMGADLEFAYLMGANLRNVKLGGKEYIQYAFLEKGVVNPGPTKAKTPMALLTGAQLNGATWVNGLTCLPGSLGKCKVNICPGTKDLWKIATKNGALRLTEFQEVDCNKKAKLVGYPNPTTKN